MYSLRNYRQMLKHVGASLKKLIYFCSYGLYVTGFAKTNLMGTNTEIHFLSVDESDTHTLSKDTKHLRLDGQVCFTRRLFPNAVKPRGCISWPVWPLRAINKAAWGAKLILTADLDFPVSCAILGRLLMVQHCHSCLSACFSLPTALHPPTPITLPAPYPPSIDSISDITAIEKTSNQGHSNSL